MKPHVLKKPLLISLFIGILVLCVIIIIAKNKQTPYEYLKSSNNDEVTAPSELLYQETLDIGFSVVFYIDQRGRYECAIIKDDFLSYKTVDISGSLSVNNTNTYLYNSFFNGKNKFDICWGVLVDNNVTEVLLDNEPCNIVNTAYGFRMFWLVGEWEDLPSLVTSS